MSRLTRRAALALSCALLYGAATGAARPALAEGASAGLSAGQVAQLREMRVGDMGKLAVHAAPRDVPDIPFLDEDGAALRLADIGGRIAVVNLWATWCAPCRYEMPSLDRLKAEMAAEGVPVIALNTERKGRIKARRFYEKEGIAHLAVHADEKNALPPRLGVIGYPVTLILGPDGRELARMQGDADWHSPNALAILRTMADMLSPQG